MADRITTLLDIEEFSSLMYYINSILKERGLFLEDIISTRDKKNQRIKVAEIKRINTGETVWKKIAPSRNEYYSSDAMEDLMLMEILDEIPYLEI